MRSDMNKVLHSRGRIGGRAFKGRMPRDAEDLPQREGMRGRYARNASSGQKRENCHYAPLHRWLESKVGLPWNDVYSELCATNDSRRFTSAKLREYALNYVWHNGLYLSDDGGVYVRSGGNSWEVTDGLYVHPRTGVLCDAEAERGPQRVVTWRQAESIEQLKVRRILGPCSQLHCRDGVWYQVALANIKPVTTMRVEYTKADGTLGMYEVQDSDSRSFDAWFCRYVRTMTSSGGVSFGIGPTTLKDLYGQPGVYAASKRQLSSTLLRAYGLVEGTRA